VTSQKINKDLDGDITKIMKDLLHRSVYAKTEMCKEEPMSDNPPLFLVAFESVEENEEEHEACLANQQELSLSKPYQVAMVPLIHKEDMYDAYDDVVRSLPVRKFEFIAVVVEGYGKDLSAETDEAEITKQFSKGDLEKEYKENPFTDVREGLMMSAVDWNMTGVWSVANMYRYDDTGVPMFDEPFFNTHPNDHNQEHGRLVEVMVATAQYMNIATQTLKYTDILKKAPKRNKGE
jgi:hypothetical protein